MTCIVGLVEGSRVWIGGDSAGVAGYYDLSVRADRKVFHNGPMLFGFTSSFRMGQILRYALVVPSRHPDVDVERFMSTTFVDAVRTCLKDNGWAQKDSEQERGGTFLVGYEGRLFKVGNDYQVGWTVNGYDACGCGEQVANGALFASRGAPPEERIIGALAAAEHHSAGVRGPFHVETMG